MAIKRYERTETIQTPRVVPASGLRAEAESWSNVGRSASAVGDLAYQEGVKRVKQAGEEEGEKAVWVDPDTGKPQIVGTLPEGTRPYAAAYRKAAEARYLSELGLSSFSKAAEIAQANNMNPEGFRNAWAGYIKGTVENVPSSIRPGTELLLKELGVKHYYKLQQEDFARTQEEAKVSTLNLVDAFERDTVDTLRTSGLAGGSPEFMQGQIARVEGLLNDQKAAGVISPTEADARLDDFKLRLVRGMVSGEAIKMVKAGKADKVDAFLSDFRRSSSDLVDDYQRNQISDFARGEVSLEIAKAKAENTAAIDAAKTQVKDAINVWWQGENFTMDDSEVLRVAASIGDKKLFAEAEDALTARTVMKQFVTLAPQQQETAIANAYSQTKHTPETLKLRELMETNYRQTISAVDSGDTLQLANARGLVTVDPINPTQPDTLKKRAADIATVDTQMGAESNPLIPAEKENLIRLFDGMDSEGKISLYGTLKEGLGEDLALRAMRQLGQERPAMALAMAVSEDSPEVARKILMGDLALQADRNILGKDEFYPNKFREHIGTAVQGDDTLRNAIYESSLAVYADMVKRNPSISSKFEAQTDAFADAIDVVTGGVVELNGFKTIVPKRGMTQDQFDTLISDMTSEQFRAAAGGNKLVTLGGQEVSSDLIRDRANLEWVGDGQYILKLKISDSLSGQTVFMADESGKLIKDQYDRPIPAELNLKPFVGGQ